MKKILICLLFVMIFLLTGCNSKGGTLYINCDSKESTINIEKGNTFSCNLTNNDYTFTIENINDDVITLKVDKTGLTKFNDNGTVNLVKEVKEFKVEKGKRINLVTQTTDYGETLTISW